MPTRSLHANAGVRMPTRSSCANNFRLYFSKSMVSLNKNENVCFRKKITSLPRCPMPKKTYEPVRTKHTLNKVKAERMPFDWSINPYRGCAHGCSFCYARQFQSFIGMGAEDEFQNHILLKMNAAEALEAQLASMARRMGCRPENAGPRIGAVAIGTATDPYQPIEGKAGITRACLKVLAKYRVPTTITTRSPLILRDADLLAEMHVTSVNISINTTDAGLTRKLEPAAPPPARRLATVRELAERGIRAGVFIAPILPYLTDSEESLEALVAAAQEHRAAFAMASVLRLSSDVKPWFFHTLNTYFPQLVGPYAKLYRSAYADHEYIESRQRLARRLLVKYGLAADVPQAPKQPPALYCPEPVQLAFEF